MKISCLHGDITEQQVDAIVNAADDSLMGGGGVDGAIHKAAGPKLLDECKALGGCAFGDAKITGGYNLVAKYVIHAVGPIYKEHEQLSPLLLRSAYESALGIADEQQLTSVAFTAISTGNYGYPKQEASEIAVETIRQFAKEHPKSSLKKIIFVNKDKSIHKIYEKILVK